MTSRVGSAERRYTIEARLIAAIAALWALLLLTPLGGSPDGQTTQTVSNVGLALAALTAAAASFWKSRQQPPPYRWVWRLLGMSAFSWGTGQVVWTWYESVLGQEVPFPGWADIGYLGAVPFAAASMLRLPGGSPSLAGRTRTILDGLIVAGSLLLVSWVLVLAPVFDAGGDTSLSKVISLAYPIGDVVVATIVVYVLLRTRQDGSTLSVPLGLVGCGLLALAVADSGFAYLTASGSYSSGNAIDIGWFVGYLLVLLAARKPMREHKAVGATQSGQPLGMMLPYAAVIGALITSMGELLRQGQVDSFVSWNRSFIIIMLVARQMLTLLENSSLTRSLEARLVDLHASEQWFEALVQQSSDVVTVIDVKGTVLYQSETVNRVLGYTPDEIRGKPLSEIVHPDDVGLLRDTVRRLAGIPSGVLVIDLRMRAAAGQWCHMEMTLTNLLENPDVCGVVLNSRDVTERKVLEDKLVHQAYHDSLTELANRALFQQRVDTVLDGDAGASRGTILFLDLDGFKEINDSLGHASGDRLLTHVAERLAACVRSCDTVARLGGDEFAVLIEGSAGEVDATALASRVITSFREPFMIEGREIRVKASIGIAVADTSVESTDQLLRNADLAMYRAKTSGGGRVERYDPAMHLDLLERLELESDLRRALGSGEFTLHYQPTVALATGRTVGVEALLRWNHREHGMLHPSVFIPLAESTGMIQPIGRWVLYEACRQAAAWHRAHPSDPPLVMSVNISAKQFVDTDLIDDVANALLETGIDPGALMLEVTESVLVDHTDENLAQLRLLKELGVQLAIDDFGTGYSSLAYLHRFPVDVLKIDRSFVEGLPSPSGDGVLVRTIVQLGTSLGIRTVAEGIEQTRQAEALVELGCEFGQGYLFAHPMSPEDLEPLIAGNLFTARPQLNARSQLTA